MLNCRPKHKVDVISLVRMQFKKYKKKNVKLLKQLKKKKA